MAQADIGLIGLAVMGENLILNMESKGFTVACFNRTVSKVDDFLSGRGQGQEHHRLPFAGGAGRRLEDAAKDHAHGQGRPAGG